VNKKSAAKFRGSSVGAERSVLARSAMVAVEPLVELLLEIGITSPQAESLLRSVFVHKAKERLVEKGGRAKRSDARVALITGVHRNVVREILSRPPSIAAAREKRGYLTGRLLRAWQTNHKYLDDLGRPRDLHEEGQAPSFTSLVTATLPSASPRFVLQELIRAGVVESLSEHRVRLRSRTMRQPGITLGNVTRYGLEGKALLGTLTRKLRDPTCRAYSESTAAINVDSERLAVVRDVLSKRASSFISGLEEELAAESRQRSRKKVRIAVSVIETGLPAGRRREGR